MQNPETKRYIDDFDWSDPRGPKPRRTMLENLKWPVIIGISALAISQSKVIETALILTGATLTLRAARSVLQAIDSCGHH